MHIHTHVPVSYIIDIRRRTNEEQRMKNEGTLISNIYAYMYMYSILSPIAKVFPLQQSPYY